MTYRYPGGLVRKTAANTSITGASGVWDLGSQAQAVKTNTWPISGLANPISGSLRFRASASAYLNRTPSVAGNRRTYTWSAWVKRSELSSNQSLFAVNNNGADYQEFRFQDSNTLRLIFDAAANNYAVEVPTVVWRDVSAWYHIVLAVDTTQATSTNRVKIYVNGIQQTVSALSGFSFPAQNFDTYVNATLPHAIGNFNYNNSLYFNGYMTEINFVNAQQLTPSSFGQTSPITGVWEPIKYTGTYGTNGFYLSLSDTSSIGKDFSGNGNNWTPNNISTANDSTFDLMRDVPTQWAPQGVTDVGGVVRGNYATLNPLDKLGSSGFPTLANGNLRATPVNTVAASTIALPTTGKWYWEATLSTGQYPEYGLARTTSPGGGSSTAVFGVYYNGTNVWLANSSDGLTDGNHAINSGDIGLVAVDVDNNKVWFGRSRSGTVVWAGGGNPATGSSPTFSASGGGGVYATTFDAQIWCFPFVASGAGSDVWNANFGQQPFVYTPPSGYKTLCTTNLPTPTIGATAANAANKYFDATLYTSTGTTQTVTNSGAMQPDFVWQKARSNSQDHYLFDAVRGSSKWLESNTTDVEGTSATFLTSFNSDGVTWGTANLPNGWTNVIWQWNAGGSTVTNTAGSISSQVRANPTAGFSIVTYTGTSANATVGHGLGVAPSMLITKPRSSADSWISWHTALGGTGYFYLDLTNASASAATVWNSTTPTSTVFSLGANGGVNASGVNFVAYCFAQVAGYSAFGSYTGNGSTDGPFVYTGFRPRFVLIKRTNATEDWNIWDSSRSPFNLASVMLRPNTSDADDGTVPGIDLLSNGFKWRNTWNGTNASGSTYIYMAFAEHPFKNALAR